MKKFNYIKVVYIQSKNGYDFYEDGRKSEGVYSINGMDDICLVLNFYGNQGWEFICWDKGGIIFKKEVD